MQSVLCLSFKKCSRRNHLGGCRMNEEEEGDGCRMNEEEEGEQSLNNT